MEIIKFTDTPFEKDENSNTGVRTYMAHTAIMAINGRYPEGDTAETHEGEARIVGMSGKGCIVAGGHTETVETDDVVIIAPGEEYYFDECESLKVLRTVLPSITDI